MEFTCPSERVQGWEGGSEGGREGDDSVQCE